MIIKGQKINDRYQIIRTIGEGGMANVYLAYDTILDRNVAVKVLRGDLSDDDKFVRRFQREAISASSLSHPNIVEMYDVGEDDGNYFIVMEFVDGKTLKSLIKRRGALSLPEVTDIMLQLTSAIACAHDSYIIHRDIKPQNVLILEDGTVKITDFGIAMALNSNELTQTNSVMGSVHYLPPEQANGNGSTIKSDIYSLGILMYELLTGKVPFKGDNAVEIAIKQMKEPIPSICKQIPSIPQSIENIVLKACAKNPKNRYDNVTEMYQDIQECMNPENASVARLTYKYPEQDMDETKVMPNLSRTTRNKDVVEEVETTSPIRPKKKKLDRGINIALIVTSSICIGLGIIAAVFAILYPKLTEVPDVVVPDVANMTEADAIQALQKDGLVAAAEIEEVSDNEIESGKVIRTNPSKGKSVKKNSEVKLYISTGSKQVTIENYVGKSYFEIKANLEAQGLYVIIEKKEVDDKDKYKENIIISQSKETGTKLAEGDTITLYIPDIITEYPNFVSEKWPIADIQKFCTEYNITLNITYEETSEYNSGTVFYQSRAAKSRVMSGTTLTIKVAQAIPDINDVIPGA